MSTLKLYHLLPSFMKDIVASGYGLLQKRRRYGVKFREFIRQLEKSQWYTFEQQKQLQSQKLKKMLMHVSKNVHYYRTMFQDLGLEPMVADPYDIIKQIPVLSKSTVQNNLSQFVANNIPKRKIQVSYTSGSSGTALKIHNTNLDHQFNYALDVSRSLVWAGIKLGDKKVMFGGRPIIPMSRKKPPFWTLNSAENQLYCSVYHMSIDTMRHYHNKIVSFKPDYFVSYPSALTFYAKYLLRNNKEIGGVIAVITSSENLSKFQREIIEKALNCEVFDAYSLAEYVNFVTECKFHSYHISPEAGLIEILKDDFSDVKDGNVGKIVSTTLYNYTMPLIRYDTGDYGAHSKKDYQCKCGRQLPVLMSLNGRELCYITLPNGKMVGGAGLTTAFKTNDVIESQFVQESTKSVKLHLVVTEDFNKSDLNNLLIELNFRLEPLKIAIEFSDSIPCSGRGKKPFIINKLKQTPQNNQ